MKGFSQGPRIRSTRSSRRRPVGISASLDATFSALSHPTRRAIIERLSMGEVSSVTELARPFHLSQPAISKHLRILEQSGLVISSKRGRVHRLLLDPAPLKSTEEWASTYRQLWEEHLTTLAAYLERMEEKS